MLFRGFTSALSSRAFPVLKRSLFSFSRTGTTREDLRMFEIEANKRPNDVDIQNNFYKVFKFMFVCLILEIN